MNDNQGQPADAELLKDEPFNFYICLPEFRVHEVYERRLWRGRRVTIELAQGRIVPCATVYRFSSF
ncbi:MAG: hypothetical protein WDO12_01665 [Pseudomonadota bacterium]